MDTISKEGDKKLLLFPGGRGHKRKSSLKFCRLGFRELHDLQKENSAKPERTPEAWRLFP